MENGNLSTYLRRGREDAGLTLDGLSQRTKVPRRLLEALEAGRFQDLPAFVFVKGFVRSYCAVVDLDPDKGVDLLTEQYGTETDATLDPTVYAAANPQPIYLTPPQVTDHRGLRISHLVLVLVAVALFVVAYVMVGSPKDELSRSTAATGEHPLPAEGSAPVPDHDARLRVAD